jgi:hypothetical protein
MMVKVLLLVVWVMGAFILVVGVITEVLMV